MGKAMKLWCITYILATLTIVNGARIQRNHHLSAPPPAPQCSDVIYDMEDCLTFLIDGATDEKPSPTCCSGFAEVLTVDGCVCEGLQGAASMGVSINMTKANILGTLCHVSAPPLSSCFSNTPAPSPGPSPAPPTTNPPTTPPPTTNPPSSSPTPTPTPPANPPANPPTTTPPTTNPPSSPPTPTTPTNPPASPPPSTPATPPAGSTPPTSGTPPSAPTTSPPSNAPEANSPSSQIHAPPSKSAGTSTMPVFLVSSLMVVASFLG